MSLLLDALRRAEEDSRKRKQGAGESVPEVQPAPELSLQETTSPDAVQAPSTGIVAQAQADASEGGFPELTLALAEPPVLATVAEPPAAPVVAPLSPRTPVQPYGRYARPTGAQAEQETRFIASQSRVATQADSRLNSPEADAPSAPLLPSSQPESVASAPATPAASVLQQARATERRALSAAGVMAGKLRPRDAGKRRQWLLAGSALLLAVPLVVFLLFGDALFGGKSTLAVANPPRVTAAPPENSPAPVASPAADPAVVAAPAASTAASSPPAVSTLASSPAAPAVPAFVPPATLPPAAATPATGARSAMASSRPRAAPLASPQATARPPAGGRDSGPGAAVALVPNAAARPASLMDAAYAAYQAGKPAEATRLYQDVLRADPTQRDAWLGLAVIAHAGNQREPAMDAYKRVLRLEPQNATALAGLSSLITNAGEPQQESRLREMLARSPQEADLNNALGLVLSGEQRWSEAQPLFFKAHSAAPLEAQFAYNLAVTLDHLRKPALAAQYYETALGLATGKVSGFDEASARNRLAALRARGPAGPAR